jgi:hypothetical protein
VAISFSVQTGYNKNMMEYFSGGVYCKRDPLILKNAHKLKLL